MTGQRIVATGGLRVWPLFWLLLGLGLIGGGLATGNMVLAAASAMPLGLAFSYGVIGRDPPFAALLGDEAIFVESPPRTIPYASIEKVLVSGRCPASGKFGKKRCRLDVQCESGTLGIPARLDVRSDELYRFLCSQITPSGRREVNAVVADFLRRQEAAFGADRVRTYCLARGKSARSQNRGVRLFSLGMAIGGGAWLALGVLARSLQGWDSAATAGIALGLVALVIGLVFGLASLVSGQPVGLGARRLRDASIVVGPQGLALFQGDLQGELAWNELQGIKHNDGTASFRLSSTVLNGIHLKLPGANVVIFDVYDRPAFLIHEKIVAAASAVNPDLGSE